MTKLFKYLRDVKGMVVLIIALLVIQAYCDLALPQYTSNIVDVGIQQGGIEYVAPEKMRPETFENLSCFLDDAQTVSYTHLDVYKRQVLCPFATVVPAGVVELAKKQEEGYSYIKP